MDSNTETRLLNFDRRISSAFGAIVVAMMLWIGSSIVSLREDLAVLKVQINTSLNEVRVIESLRIKVNRLSVDMQSIKGRLKIK